MTLSKFKQYCEQKQPHIITYNDENDRAFTLACRNTNHFEALRLVLAFDSVTVEYNPNVIYFKGDCGVMYINNVQCVSVNSGCMLGDVVTVTAGTSNGQRKYTLLFQ